MSHSAHGPVWPRQVAGALRALVHATSKALAVGLTAVPASETAAGLRLFRSAVLVGLQEVARGACMLSLRPPR
jgi:hypothetical protein